MSGRRGGWRAAAVAGLLLAGSCGVEEPVPAEAVLELQSPHADDGAVAFTVTTPESGPIDSAFALCNECEVFMQRADETTINLIVTGPLPHGPIARLRLTPGMPATWYQIRLVAVASRTFQSRGLTGYRLTVR